MSQETVCTRTSLLLIWQMTLMWISTGGWGLCPCLVQVVLLLFSSTRAKVQSSSNFYLNASQYHPKRTILFFKRGIWDQNSQLLYTHFQSFTNTQHPDTSGCTKPEWDSWGTKTQAKLLYMPISGYLSKIPARKVEWICIQSLDPNGSHFKA